VPSRALGTRAAPRVDSAFAPLLPIATTAAAAVLMLLPVRIPGYAALTPAFALMAVYHWTIYRPDLLPPLAVFAIGAGQDLLSGAPLGVGALVLLLARAAVLRNRRHFVNRGFPFIWAGFTLLTAAASGFLWALYQVIDGGLADPRGAMFQAVLTISLFPVASVLRGRAQRALMAAR
jgi:rod shape-determining protein MreD